MIWRDLIKVHPAADLFPLMGQEEFGELRADIKKNGLQVPIEFVIGEGELVLVDDRNRMDAMEQDSCHFRLLGAGSNPTIAFGADAEERLAMHVHDGDPYDLGVSLNLVRRHINAEQKRDLIAKLLTA